MIKLILYLAIGALWTFFYWCRNRNYDTNDAPRWWPLVTMFCWPLAGVFILVGMAVASIDVWRMKR